MSKTALMLVRGEFAQKNLGSSARVLDRALVGLSITRIVPDPASDRRAAGRTHALPRLGLAIGQAGMEASKVVGNDDVARRQCRSPAMVGIFGEQSLDRPASSMTKERSPSELETARKKSVFRFSHALAGSPQRCLGVATMPARKSASIRRVGCNGKEPRYPFNRGSFAA